MLSIVSSPAGDVTVLLTNSFKLVSRYNVAFSRKLTLFTWFVRFHLFPFSQGVRRSDGIKHSLGMF